MKNELYNAEQVAEYFDVRVETVRDWIKRGILQGFKAGRDWRFTQKNIDDCTEALRAITDEKRRTLEQRIPELAAMLDKEEAAFWTEHKEKWPAAKQWILDFIESNPGIQVRFDSQHGLLFSMTYDWPGTEPTYPPELAIVRR